MGKRIESPHFLVQTGRPVAKAEPTNARRPERKGPATRQKPAAQKKPIPRQAKKKRIITSGKLVRGHKLRPIIDDPKYIIDLRSEPCIFTGLRGTEDDPVEAMHIGNCGKGIKSANEALPARHSIHALTHTKEGILALIPHLITNPHLLIDAFRALARERYEIAKAEAEPQDLTPKEHPHA